VASEIKIITLAGVNKLKRKDIKTVYSIVEDEE